MNPEPTITLEQLRTMLVSLHQRMDGIEAALSSVRDGLAQAATPAPAGTPNSTSPGTPNSTSPDTPAGKTVTYIAEDIIFSYDDNGQPIYRARGGAYGKFGVRVWPEVWPNLNLGLDLKKLKPGANPLPKKVVLRVMGAKGALKVVGLA